ncbi:MAG TPA: LysE family translocator [Solirubrobacteraceae bacterium]|nr:LysE family translocator [Solirubrobacteraceae bacterium]
MSEVLAFVGVAVLVIVTPGPDTAITIRGTLLGGRRAGLLTACGVVTGQACWTVAASAGVTALLVASEPAFLALKLAGAAYLVYLGGQAVLAAIRGTTHAIKAGGTFRPRTAYRQGLVSDLGNPKMAAFFTSLLPQFGTTFATMLAFGLLFCVLTWLWLALYAGAIAKLRLGRVYRVIQAVTGAVLVALGVRLAAEGGSR